MKYYNYSNLFLLFTLFQRGIEENILETSHIVPCHTIQTPGSNDDP